MLYEPEQAIDACSYIKFESFGHMLHTMPRPKAKNVITAMIPKVSDVRIHYYKISLG